MILPAVVVWGQVCGKLPESAQLVSEMTLFGRRPGLVQRGGGSSAPCFAVTFYWPEADTILKWFAIGVGGSYPRVTFGLGSEEQARAAARAHRWVRSWPRWHGPQRMGPVVPARAIVTGEAPHAP